MYVDINYTLKYNMTFSHRSLNGGITAGIHLLQKVNVHNYPIIYL